MVATLLAGARRAGHRRSRSGARARRRACSARAQRPMVLTARGPEQQAQGVDNVLAFINLALALRRHGQPFARLRHAHRPGQRPGRPRARAEGRPAARLSSHRRSRRRARTSPPSGASRRRTLPGPGKSAYELLDDMGRDGGVRALFVMGSNPVVSAPARARTSRSGCARSTCSSSPTSSCPRPRALADVVLPSAQWAEEDGTMTNLEGRVIRRRRAVRSARRACAPTSTILRRRSPSASGTAPHFAFADAEAVFDELRRATRGRRRRLLRHHLREDRRAAAACSGRARPRSTRARRASSPSASRRRADARASTPCVTSRRPRSPTRDYPLYLTTGRVLAQYQSGTQTRRVAAARRASRPSRSPRSIRSTARRAGIVDGALVTLTTRRGSSTAPREAHARHPRRHRVRAVPLGRRPQSVNRLTNPALDPTSRMPEFKVCAVRIEPQSARQGATSA